MALASGELFAAVESELSEHVRYVVLHGIGRHPEPHRNLGVGLACPDVIEDALFGGVSSG